MFRHLAYAIGAWMMAFSAAAQTVNVAAAANGGVATASSSYSSAYGPEKAIDGLRNAPWSTGGGWNDGTVSAFPDWVQVNFNGVKSINEIDVFLLPDNLGGVTPTPTMTFTLYGLTAFKVQYWDGAAWVDVPGGNVTGNSLVWRRFTFAPVSTDRIRVQSNSSPNGWSALTEIEAWTNVSVSLTAPANNTMLAPPATVDLSATAGDAIGSLSKVEFYRDATLVATVTTPSSGTSSSGTYTASDTNVPAGTYSYTAKAYDSADASLVAISQAAVVSVSQGAGAVNVAAAANGGVATASSAYTVGGSYPPSGAINGDREGLSFGAGGAWTDATINTFPDWLQVQFSSVQSISEIDVFWLQDNYMAPVEPTPTMRFTLYGVTAFQVQYWDGSAWVDVPGGNVTGNNLVWRRFTFAPINTDRIRVLVNNSLAPQTALTEIEAWMVPTPAAVDQQISGTVTAGGAPLAGVMLVATNGGVCASSNSAGQYSCTVAQGWSGNVTPLLNGYAFTPFTHGYTGVQANQSGQDFAATVASGDTTYYINVDHLNTPRLVADQQGATVWKWEQQEPFGSTPPNDNPSGLGAFDLPLRLPGQYYDKESGLHYNYYRDYDSSIGRYIQEDPIGLAGGLNGYSYVGGNPLGWNDPLGLMGQGNYSSRSAPGPLRFGGGGARKCNCKVDPPASGDVALAVGGAATAGAVAGGIAGGSYAAAHTSGALAGVLVAEGVWGGAVAGGVVVGSAAFVAAGLAIAGYYLLPNPFCKCDESPTCK